MRKVLHLMGTLNDQDIDWLARHGQTRFAPAGLSVIDEGRPIDALFVLLEGRLSVRKGTADSREVAILYPGEVLGEISFVDTRPPSASVVPMEDSHIFAVPKDLLTQKLEADSGFAARFYRALATFLVDRLRTTTAHLGYGTWPADTQTDEIDDATLDDISLAARRFDEMLHRLRVAS
jgi:CRP/FNR family transcriptional regulator, cyclic AMP receptor protein